MSKRGSQAGTWVFSQSRGTWDLMSINVMRSQRKTRLLVTSNGFVFLLCESDDSAFLLGENRRHFRFVQMIQCLLYQ
jgi:hypothetical protein